MPATDNFDAKASVKSVLAETDNIIQSGKVESKILKQVYTEYFTLLENGIIVNVSENTVLNQVLKDKKKYKRIKPSEVNKLDEFNKMQYLILLMNNGIKKSTKTSPFKDLKISDISDSDIEKLFEEDNLDRIHEEMYLAELYSETIARFYSFIMNHSNSGKYIPILATIPGLDVVNSSQVENPNKFKVINAVLNTLPMPDVNTPLQEVLDFKKDSEAQGHILALNNWMIDTATKNLSSKEIEQKIEYLIFEYDRFIKINKLKFSASKLEIVVTAVAEIAENLARLKFGEVAKTAFQLFKTDVNLMEAEMNAPGKEVAYISSLRNEFSR